MERPLASISSSSTSRPSSRRTSGTAAYESLPTPPPDPPGYGGQENIFVYNAMGKDLTRDLQGLLKFGERQNEFQKRLRQSILSDCQKKHQTITKDDPIKCECCERLYKEYELIMEPLQNRLNSSITTAIAAYGSINQLDRLYKIWDRYLSLENALRQKQYSLHYADLLRRRLKEIQTSSSEQQGSLGGKMAFSDTEMNSQELEQSLNLLENILHLKEKPTMATSKGPESKIQRERSKSFAIEDTLEGQHSYGKHIAGLQHLLRRQSTFADTKSKVSKWTKVKAAFKWEKANVATPIEVSRNILTPNNNELARYLRVPSIPHGGSSPESAFSSSSGHLISEGGTPGTMSSASSVDDFDNNNSKSKTASRSDERNSMKSINTPGLDESMRLNTPPKIVSSKYPSKSRIASDTQVAPENFDADLAAIMRSKNRNIPSPLDLNVKKDPSDLSLSASFRKCEITTTQEGTQSLNRAYRKINSPINSSVPSSPSRYSDFFAEYEESEGHSSSADFSDTNGLNDMQMRKRLEQQQREINRRYEVLRVKLDMEFEAKRKEWNKMKSSRAMALLSASKPNEMVLEAPTINAPSNTLSNEFLEEQCAPDFRKKLQKWRVRKQASIGGLQGHTSTPVAASGPSTAVQENQVIIVNKDSKIDWQLWKTGQLKLEGQGLTPLPDQKDLSEEFQKKLEQWDKMKRGGTSVNSNDSGKRPYKHGVGSMSSKKGQSDEDKRADKHKTHDKEKLERLAKLKAIVGEHPAKEIEVKTSAGVMKFEGISRKFTRKLYEWEKARGIGPESSTFALLHPGYCPIDVKRIPKENRENSPNLSHSLSLDSLAPTLTLTGMSHQASSLSLNDVNDLKELKETSTVNKSSDHLLLHKEFKAFDEPEAVMVEVEDCTEETASELIPVIDFKQRPQNAICKYEENACNDFCNTRKVHSFDGNINMAPLLNALKGSEELLEQLRAQSSSMMENGAMKQCFKLLELIRNNYAYYSDNLMEPTVYNCISDVQNELSRLRDLSIKAPLDEACCKEVMEERTLEYNIELQGLLESLRILRDTIKGDCPNATFNLPDINIITENDLNIDESITLDVPLDTATVQRNTRSPITTGNSNSSLSGGKKRVRLRKVSSLRQNSKSDSDSSECEMSRRMIIGTPRRHKRKSYRFKPLSFDDDPKVLKKCLVDDLKSKREGNTNMKYSENQSIQRTSRESNSFKASAMTISTSLPNVFVKTKRKVFKAIEEPTAFNGVAVLEQEVARNNDDCEAIVHHHHATPYTSVTKSNNNPNEMNIDLDALVRPRLLLVHKSLSLDDVRCDPKSLDATERLTHSMETVNNCNKKLIQEPLASDSICLLYNKKRDAYDKVLDKGRSIMLLKKAHLFRKRNEETTKTSIIARIESKIAKTHSISIGKRLETIDLSMKSAKRDNNLSGESKSIAARNYDTIKWDYEQPSMNSEPVTPAVPYNFIHTSDSKSSVSKSDSGSRTPLTERALRLRKAKEDFLNNYYYNTTIGISKMDENGNQYQCQNILPSHESNLSLSSTVGDESSRCSESITEFREVNDIQRSNSADTVRPETPPTYSDTGTEMEYDSSSVYQPVTRSKNITSKFGFATLASKFRKVKAGGKKSKSTTLTTTTTTTSWSRRTTAISSTSALTTLCRQSLFADIIAASQISKAAEDHANTERIRKSKSSPNSSIWTFGMGMNASMHYDDSNIESDSNAERLNKSYSEQHVKRPSKESFV